jgi:uncharacterized membrane protein
MLLGYLDTHIINKSLNTDIINFEKNISIFFKIFVGITSIYLFFPRKDNIILTTPDKYFGVSSGILLILSVFV